VCEPHWKLLVTLLNMVMFDLLVLVGVGATWPNTMPFQQGPFGAALGMTQRVVGLGLSGSEKRLS
jgi:hypothetical protein